jgi:hypothetical protein
MRSLVVLVGMVACLGCVSVLRKAKLQHIRNVGVLSLFAAERIPESRGQGVLRQLDSEGKLQIAEDALQAFQEAFGSLGWEVRGTEEVTSNAVYAERLAKKPAPNYLPGKASNAFASRYFSPPSMVPLWLDEVALEKPSGRPFSKTDPTLIAETMAELGIDTSALVRLQYCFRTFLRQRKERLVVTCAAGVQLVNSQGEKLFERETPRGCGEAPFSESSKSLPIGSEDWVYDPLQRDSIRALFKEASQNEAARLVRHIPFSKRTKQEIR